MITRNPAALIPCPLSTIDTADTGPVPNFKLTHPECCVEFAAGTFKASSVTDTPATTP